MPNLETRNTIYSMLFGLIHTKIVYDLCVYFAIKMRNVLDDGNDKDNCFMYSNLVASKSFRDITSSQVRFTVWEDYFD